MPLVFYLHLTARGVSAALNCNRYHNAEHACRAWEHLCCTCGRQHSPSLVNFHQTHLTPVEHRALACHGHLLSSAGMPPMVPRPWHLLLALCT